MACTAAQLIDKLAASGTGTGKLVAFRHALQQNPKASAHDLIDVCREQIPAGTLAKAIEFAGPAPKPEPKQESEKARKGEKGGKQESEKAGDKAADTASEGDTKGTEADKKN